MLVELRKVKIHKDMSEETTCYSAEIWLDGVKAGSVSNDGHGGCDRIHPRALHDRLDAYAKTLPPGRYPNTFETVTAKALDEYIGRKAFDRDIKKRCLFIDDKGALRLTKVLPPASLPNAVAHWTAQGKKVLNALPLDEAFALYMKATAPKDEPEATPEVKSGGLRPGTKES